MVNIFGGQNLWGQHFLGFNLLGSMISLTLQIGQIRNMLQMMNMKVQACSQLQWFFLNLLHHYWHPLTPLPEDSTKLFWAGSGEILLLRFKGHPMSPSVPMERGDQNIHSWPWLKTVVSTMCSFTVEVECVLAAAVVATKYTEHYWLSGYPASCLYLQTKVPLSLHGVTGLLGCQGLLCYMWHKLLRLEI